MAYITKGVLWDLLGSEALTFAGFLLTPEGATVKLMFDNTDGITLESPLIQDQLLPMLLTKGAITQAVVDRVNVEIARQELAQKVYTPQELKDLILADTALAALVTSGDDLLIANSLNSRGINVNHLQVAYALRGI